MIDSLYHLFHLRCDFMTDKDKVTVAGVVGEKLHGRKDAVSLELIRSCTTAHFAGEISECKAESSHTEARIMINSQVQSLANSSHCFFCSKLSSMCTEQDESNSSR